MSPPSPARRTADTAALDRIADRMRARIGEMIGVWGLRGGYRDGHDWVCLNPTRADRRPGSFRIALSGPLQGLVTDFAGEAFPGAGRQSVSPLSFHIRLMHNGDKRAGVEWAKDWLGLSGRDPAALQVTHRALRDFDERPVQDMETVERRRKFAKRIYLSARPLTPDCPAWLYLAGRGLDPGRLGFPVSALRFEPRLYCSALGPVTDDAAFLPGVVMPITGMKGEYLGTHRIWIEEVGGRWVKSPRLKEAKKALAPYAGGVIRLWNGTRVIERTGEVVYGRDFARADGPLRVHLTEGPEDGLAVALACSEERVHVAVSVNNMGGLAYPDKVAEVVLWRQADPPGSQGAASFGRACANFHAQGKIVRVADVAAVVPGVKDPAEVFERGGAVDA